MDDFYTEYGVPLFIKSGTDPGFYNSEQPGKNIAKWIFSEAGINTNIFSLKLFKALLIKKDMDFLQQYRNGLQEILNSSYYHLSHDSPQSEHLLINNKELQLDAIVTAALAMLPYTEPNSNKPISIPIKINSIWYKVPFIIERIQLTNSIFGAPYYAYGLIPTGEHAGQVSSKLLFMGTNIIPTQDGCHHTIMSDLVPGQSIGEHLYKSGENKIKDWIELHTKPNSNSSSFVEAIGQSMGGSIAIITHLCNPSKVRAKAFNPPALLISAKSLYANAILKVLKNNDQLIEDPVLIYTQKQDPIFQLGVWLPENSIIYRISSSIGDKLNYFANHKDCFASHSAKNNLKFDLIDPVYENSRFERIITTMFLQILSVPAFLINCTLMLLKAIFNIMNETIYNQCMNAHKLVQVDTQQQYDYSSSNPIVAAYKSNIGDLDVSLQTLTLRGMSA